MAQILENNSSASLSHIDQFSELYFVAFCSDFTFLNVERTVLVRLFRDDAVLTVASVNTCHSTCLSVCLGARAPTLKIYRLHCSVINICEHKQLFPGLKPVGLYGNARISGHTGRRWNVI